MKLNLLFILLLTASFCFGQKTLNDILLEVQAQGFPIPPTIQFQKESYTNRNGEIKVLNSLINLRSMSTENQNGRRNDFFYNELGLQSKSISTNYSNGTWEENPIQINENIYNEDDQQSVTILQVYDEDLGAIVNYRKFDFFYKDGLIDSAMEFYWDTNTGWTEHIRRQYSYEDERLSLLETEELRDNVWYPNQRWEYISIIEGNILTEETISQNWNVDNNTWEGFDKTIIAYQDEIFIQYTYQVWNNDAQDWLNFYHSESQLDELNRVSEYVNISYWQEPGVPISASKENYIYEGEEPHQIESTLETAEEFDGDTPLWNFTSFKKWDYQGDLQVGDTTYAYDGVTIGDPQNYRSTTYDEDEDRIDRSTFLWIEDEYVLDRQLTYNYSIMSISTNINKLEIKNTACEFANPHKIGNIITCDWSSNNSPTQLKIYDFGGKLIHQQTVDSSNEFTIGKNLLSGMYLMTLEGNGTIYYKDKLVITE